MNKPRCLPLYVTKFLRGCIRLHMIVQVTGIKMGPKQVVGVMMMQYVLMMVAKLEEGMAERVIVYKFMESQNLKINTMGDKFEKKDLKEMILEDKLMLMQGLEEDIKGNKFQQMQNLVMMKGEEVTLGL
jgi:hypothetical protein